jgi:hypothetical protein
MRIKSKFFEYRKYNHGRELKIGRLVVAIMPLPFRTFGINAYATCDVAAIEFDLWAFEFEASFWFSKHMLESAPDLARIRK